MIYAHTSHPRWKVGIVHSFTVRVKSLDWHTGTRNLKASDGSLVAQLVDDRLTIFAGYTCDGGTMAPDFRQAIRGYVVHDALLQILDLHPGAFDEQAAHDAMLQIHREDRYWLRKPTHYAVSKWPRQFLYKRIIKPIFD